MKSAESDLGTSTIRLALEQDGYAVRAVEPHQQELLDTAREIGGLVGAQSMGVLEIAGTGADRKMSNHTESIIFSEDILPKYFALGCLKSAISGGGTVVYDGRLAARRLLDKSPELARVRMRYVSTVYEGQQAEHPLVFSHPLYGPVLRYRSAGPNNHVVSELPAGMSDVDLYDVVDRILKDSDPYVHAWKEGQILVVNNHMTIHSRLPYQGDRVMMRFRYDDPYFQTVTIGTGDVGHE